jgi:prophage antirepressor-like protein
MMEEIKTNNNCIVKAFENNPISILNEDIDNKKIYYFKASDIGRALNLTNIAVSIQHYDEDERVIRKAYDTTNREQDTIFLTSQGVYRLLYNSKKEMAKKFRKWAGNILDDIIFNESKELKLQIENKDKLLENKNQEIENKDKLLENNCELQRHNILLKEYGNSKYYIVYLIKVKSIDDKKWVLKIGESRMGITNRYKEHKSKYPECIVLDIFLVKRCKEFERFLHQTLNGCRYKELSGHENENELFLVGEELSYSYIIKLIQDNIRNYNDDLLEVQSLNLEVERLKIENQKLKLKNTNDNSTDIENLRNEIVNLKEFIKDQFKKIDVKLNLKRTNNFGEEYHANGPKVQQINPDTFRLIKVYRNVTEVINTLKIPRSSLTKAIRENTIYKNSRWSFVETDQDENIVKINQTRELKKLQNNGYIAKLNKEKDTILNVYLDRRTASMLNNYNSVAYLDDYVKTGKPVGDYYYVLYEKCDTNLKKTFIEKIGKNDFLLYKNGVGQFDKDNNLLHEFTSKYNCKTECGIGDKSLSKAIITNTMYNGYYYKYLEERLVL